MLTWLGIGAQRSGTTWFTEMLLQHPECRLGRSNTKELHILDRAIEHGDVDRVRKAFCDEFQGLDGAAGEWTPAYLRALWAPGVALEVIDPVVVLVLLRDPIERFHSAIRLNARLAAGRRRKRDPGFLPSRAMEAQWGSSYVPQLEAWTDAFGRERMLVMQYEAVAARPREAVEEAWKRMGLPAAPLVVPPRVDPPAPYRGSLQTDRAVARLIAPQLHALEDWGIDLTLWDRLRESLK